MAANPSRLFDPGLLLAAVDAQRKARGLTWAELSRQLNVSVSTMKGMPAKTVLEADGVLQMTRWLGRRVESFCGPGADPGSGPEPGDRLSTGRFLRFDSRALYAAVEAACRRRGVSLEQARQEIPWTGPVSRAVLTRLKEGGRVDLYQVLAIVGWLGARVEDFTHLTRG